MTVKPISTTTTGGLGVAGLQQGGLSLQGSQASTGLKLPNLTATTSTTAAATSGGTGLGGLGGLKQTTTSSTSTTAAAPTLGLGLGRSLAAASTSAATAAASATSKAQTTLKTEFKGLGGVGTVETTKKGAGRDGLVLTNMLIAHDSDEIFYVHVIIGLQFCRSRCQMSLCS